MRSKIFTFIIEYEKENKEKTEMKICANDEFQARTIFEVRCRNDFHLERPYKIISVFVEYNEADAKKYGKHYGKPEEHDVDEYPRVLDDIAEFLDSIEKKYGEIKDRPRVQSIFDDFLTGNVMACKLFLRHDIDSAVNSDKQEKAIKKKFKNYDEFLDAVIENLKVTGRVNVLEDATDSDLDAISRSVESVLGTK